MKSHDIYILLKLVAMGERARTYQGLAEEALMSDLKNPKWMYCKAGAILVILIISAALLIDDSPSWRTVVSG